MTGSVGATRAPEVGAVVAAETLGSGQSVRVEVTLVEELDTGWRVWGYRSGRSSFTKGRPRRSAYPNEYWLPRIASAL